MHRKYLVGIAALATVAWAGSASAAVIALDSMAPIAANTQFNYQATFTSDEGLRPGDTFYVFDFAGYVDGSVAATNADFAASSEFASPGIARLPSVFDDPTIANLVFTYTGPDYRTTGGPYSSFSFGGFSAVSTFLNTVTNGFTSFTTKNNPTEVENTTLATLGDVVVPTAGGVPEPASWAMLIAGFGMIGAVSRRRRIPTVAA